MSSPHILILAAGASSRMRGADKLMEPVDGQPLLARTVRMALATGLPVTVTLPPDRPARHGALDGLDVAVVTVEDAAIGLSASLKAGLAALPAKTPVMLLLADLPEISAEDLSTLLRVWQDDPDVILRGASASGQPGHPVCFPPWARAALLAVTGDEGARSVLLQYRDRLRLVPLPGAHATTDLDTPEDWVRWRQLRGQ